MICRLHRALALSVFLAWTPAVAAQAPPAGATSCSGCHTAKEGASPVPVIVGRPVGELMTAVAEFRSGKRPATVMDRLLKGFTDDELRDIAQWLADQKK